MATVLIVAYLMIVLALIAVILLQRSEGGGLGMGSPNSTGLISVRGTANLLTRTTAILAALFFASAIGLTILTEIDRGGTSTILERAAQQTGTQPTTVLDAIQQMQKQTQGSDLPVPAPAAPAPTDTTAPAAPAAGTTPAAPAAGATTTPAPAASDLPVPAAPATTEQPAAPAN